jgi:hypothetical protein
MDEIVFVIFYRCMALVSSAFNFQWSRWNLLAGRQKMIYQMRERHGASTPVRNLDLKTCCDRLKQLIY